MRQAASSLVLVVCGFAACAYRPGTSGDRARDQAEPPTSIGCVDVAIDRRADLGTSAVLDFTLGNRCAQPTSIDLAWGSVIGRTANGAEIALVPDDPERQLHAVTLDAHGTRTEAIRYPASEALGQLCVDVASLAHARPAQWRCFGNREAVAQR